MGSMLEDLVPIVGAVLLCSIPIIAILTEHQRKMAALLRGQSEENALDTQRMKEIAEKLDELSVRLSRIESALPGASDGASLENRLGG